MLRLLPVFLILAACVAVPEPVTRGARVLAIGDSVMAWNRQSDQSLIDAAERVLGEEIVNAAVPGARMRASGLRAAVGLSIPAQYRDGDWTAVVVNGGANDLRANCGCRACDAELTALITRDGTGGAYPALLARTGRARVVILGYYGPVRGGGGSFDGCDDELQELERRLARLAARDRRVTLVTVRDVIDGAPRLYAPDRVHPSPIGSARIGAKLGAALVAIVRPAR